MTSNNIRKVRRSKDITQEELAKSSGVSRPYLSNVEKGKSIPSVDISLKIAKGLGVNVEDIFFAKPVLHVGQDKEA